MKTLPLLITVSVVVVVVASATWRDGRTEPPPDRGHRAVTPVVSPNALPAAGPAALSEARSGPTGTPRSADDYVPVTRVLDGDTIAVLLPEGERRVRLLGVDTPETADPRKSVQCFGPEASEYTRSRLGPRVRLEPDPARSTPDRYGRLLRYVYRTDGTLFNLRLVSAGYGREYTFRGQPYRHQAAFKRAEAVARSTGRGLWSAC